LGHLLVFKEDDVGGDDALRDHPLLHPEHQTLALRAKVVFGLEQEAALVVLRIFEYGKPSGRE